MDIQRYSYYKNIAHELQTTTYLHVKRNLTQQKYSIPKVPYAIFLVFMTRIYWQNQLVVTMTVEN